MIDPRVRDHDAIGIDAQSGDDTPARILRVRQNDSRPPYRSLDDTFRVGGVATVIRSRNVEDVHVMDGHDRWARQEQWHDVGRGEPHIQSMPDSDRHGSDGQPADLRSQIGPSPNWRGASPRSRPALELDDRLAWLRLTHRAQQLDRVARGSRGRATKDRQVVANSHGTAEPYRSEPGHALEPPRAVSVERRRRVEPAKLAAVIECPPRAPASGLAFDRWHEGVVDVNA
jgi:hypothetical protein